MATPLTRFLETAQPGDVGYFTSKDAAIITTAKRKGWKITTRRLVAVVVGNHRDDPEAIALTEVTLLGRLSSDE